jgi:hypothetical protein
MFALDDTFLSEILYVFQTDFYLKGLAYVTGVILFLELLRTQISEVDLLQLIPGFYFLLFFISFLTLFFFSELFFRIPYEIDNLKSYGTKVTSKIEIKILLKISFFLFSILLIIILNSVLPLSLDSFNSSGEKTLDNIWAFSEVLYLELILIVILTVISQIPLFFIINFNTQKVIVILSQFWKFLILMITLIAGFLTPTLDGYTQISFALSSFLFYLFIVNFLQKRTLLKLNIFLTFGS